MSNQRGVMETRARRIVETAMRLAEKGGFAAVRLRDVASEAGVALGTVYKRFQSKEDILIASLELLLSEIQEHLRAKPITGDSKLERINDFFQKFTSWLCERPNVARAVLRAMAAGEPELAAKIIRFYSNVSMMIAAAILGPEKTQEIEADLSLLTEAEFNLTLTLPQLWFAGMVGWTSGLYSPEDVTSQVHNVTELLLLGIEVQATTAD